MQKDATHNKEYQPLTVPRLAWNSQTLTKTFGELVAEPLDPGFGFTLGNALRRVMYGAIEGSAVTAVVIKGVNNEFSTVPGVVEDTMQLCLNIKQIIVGNSTGLAGKMRLVVKGEQVATVADIKCDEHLELLNKEHILAHVASDGILDIEFFVEPGRGYQAAQWPIGEGLQADGKIYLDAMFSPIRNVTFDVEKTRVGRNIDYDKLKLTVTTDGTIAPVDALHYSVSVLRNQLETFLTAPEIPFNEISPRPGEEQKEVEDKVDIDALVKSGINVELLLKPIDVLEFSVRAHNCLINAGIKKVIDLVNLSEDDITKIKNFGAKSLEEVRESMKAFGLSFGLSIKESALKKMLEKGSKS